MLSKHVTIPTSSSAAPLGRNRRWRCANLLHNSGLLGISIGSLFLDVGDRTTRYFFSINIRTKRSKQIHELQHCHLFLIRVKCVLCAESILVPTDADSQSVDASMEERLANQELEQALRGDAEMSAV